MRIPTSPRPGARAARHSISILVLALSATSLVGCIGGAERRDASGVSMDESHWVFPLYRYRKVDGRGTVYPLFLFPVPVSDDHRKSASTEDELALRGHPEGDAPAWGAEGTSGPTDRVEPGIWGASVPPSEAGASTSAAGVDPHPGEHEVRAGETLYAIAKQYYGTGKEWTRIADANRDRIRTPESLAVGVRLRIP